MLRVLADRTPHPARFLVLGSAAPDLLRQGSETLAGRIAFYELSGFDLGEVGASFEGFAIEQVLLRLGARAGESYFWATYSGAELDLLVVRGRKRLGFEFKRTDAPRLSPAMTTALDVLGLERIDVVHAGAESYPMHRKVRAVPLARLLEELKPLA